MERLIGKLSIKGNIVLETGLHIGGSETEMQIGGVDNPVIKTIDGKPYIPGSSLKGKLRSLLECATGNVTEKKVKNGKECYVCSCGKCYICKLFGSTKDVTGRTRLIFRDCHLNKEDENKAKSKLVNIKTENVIDRLTGKAKHPRQLEKVVRGTKFNYEIIMNIFESDINKDKGNEKKVENICDYFKVLLLSFELLKNDYLGGSGSRGYGKLDIKASQEDSKAIQINNFMSVSTVYIDSEYFESQENINIKSISLDNSKTNQLLQRIRKQYSNSKKTGDSNDRPS